MLGRLARLLLAATSLAPVLLTWAFADWRVAGANVRQLTVVAVAVLLVVLCFLLLLAAKNQLPVASFDASSVRPADTEVVGFVVAYLLPLVTTSTNQIDYAVLGFVGVLLLVVVWSANAYSFNPLLTVFGYHFYEVTGSNGVTYLMLTRHDVRRVRDVRQVAQLTNYLVLDASREE